MKWICAIAGVAMALVLVPSAAFADSIAAVEGARAKERQGAYLSRQDVEQLNRHGGNDSYRYNYGNVYNYDSYDYDADDDGYSDSPYDYDDGYDADDAYGPVVEVWYDAY